MGELHDSWISITNREPAATSDTDASGAESYMGQDREPRTSQRIN